MCVFVCSYVEPVSRSKDYVWSGIKLVLSYACVHLCRRLHLKYRVCICTAGGHHFFEDVPLVEFTYFVFARMPDESYCR